MYDEYARNLIEQLPLLGDLDRNACRRALSSAYFHVVRARIQGAQGDPSNQQLLEVQSILRKMANALESVAVFDSINGISVEPSVESACAFVAAEAVALLSELYQPAVDNLDVIRDTRHYPRIEAALLYMIAGYDINAAAVGRELPEFAEARESEDLRAATARNGLYLISRLRAMCSGDARTPARSAAPYTGFDEQPVLFEDILLEARLRCYALLANVVNAYLDWLAGGDDNGLQIARARVDQVRRAALPEGHEECVSLADVYHLSSLLRAAIDRTSERSVLHHIPDPITENAIWIERFRAYLKSRVVGTAQKAGRVYLWPSVQQFIATCVPGPKCDAVIAMPTGSGKSFVAELAIADAICRGSVIYLAPTNALVHQIRRDLSVAFRSFRDLRVLAFIGSGEYSGVLEDVLEEAVAERFIAVMTPEKCALALRLAPEAFQNLTLCVFDEVHLLNDDNRGVVADILLAQLFAAAPKMHFILMSAMVSNPEELAAWLASTRGSKCAPNITKWRPSRTLRGVLAIERERAKAGANAAIAALKELQRTQPRRVNQLFEADLALIAGLSGPWTLDGPADYRMTELPISFQASATLRAGKANVNFVGWKNSSSSRFAESLARAGVPSIAFILSSRHHAFSLACQIDQALPQSPTVELSLPDLIAAWLAISDAELGVNTSLREFLSKGVAVHTSAMLQTEQAAAEWMFEHHRALLMFATPTLAQGLNLPAIGVVVAGTSMGDPREQRESDQIAGLGGRATATILNSFGRAGRPGFANQGIAVLVTDKPQLISMSDNFDARAILRENRVLGEADAAVRVRSPIETFLDRVLLNPDPFTTASDVELELTTLLAESPAENDSGKVLRRTFAGYQKRALFTQQASEQVRARIEGLKETFLQQPGLPPWLNTAAMKSGVDVFRAWRLWEAYQQRGLVSAADGAALDVAKWLEIFVEAMSELPPRRVVNYMAEISLPSAQSRAARGRRSARQTRTTVLARLRDAGDALRYEDSVPWQKPSEWRVIWRDMHLLVDAFMRGETYAHIAHLFLGVPLENVTGDRRTGGSIPKVFGLLRKVFEPLARDAGCFVALNELFWQAAAGSVVPLPEPLQALPLCIRYGCNSPDTLGWFRFGYRQRICAHALARAFPIPSEVQTDGERSKWIRSTRLRWLRGEVSPPEAESALCAHARTVIVHTDD